ncbi:hypothetical protein SAMN04488134_106134 [Amphibacillus marinus]|uniref:Uncharacterized protein n=1 Tax=Amphibacillus marinus TaxID=872970 RepID=A0A1H8NX67_9BACI|nr:hypothetical protein [Amphibacillus marinus]SEO34171.1 hypothetical protein SAMN04488134_106134 [Amphibacillus marinus]
MECINCKSKNIGQISQNHYYCWNCFVEMHREQDVFHIHEVDLDGSLLPLNDLFSEDERRVQ